DEDDRKEQEQRDRPLGLSPPRADHACAKAPCAHNGFPDSRGSQEAYATPSCSKNCARRRWPTNRKARAARPEATESVNARCSRRVGLLRLRRLLRSVTVSRRTSSRFRIPTRTSEASALKLSWSNVIFAPPPESMVRKPMPPRALEGFPPVRSRPNVRFPVL